MTEIEIARAAPQTRVQNPEVSKRQILRARISGLQGILRSMMYLQVWRDPRAAPNDVIYAQPKICKAWRVVPGEKRKAEITCDKDDLSPIPKLRNVLYPMRYASPTLVVRQSRIDEENEDEEDDEGDEKDEGVSRVTRF